MPLEDEAGGGFTVPKAAWDAATDPSLPEGTAEVNGHRIEFAEPDTPPGNEGASAFGLAGELMRDWAKASDPQPAEARPEVTPAGPAFGSWVMEVSQDLLDDYARMGDALNDYLARGLRGELPPSPPRQPKRHRCLACWLVSLLPGHDRCSHGYLEGGCETCGEW